MPTQKRAVFFFTADSIPPWLYNRPDNLGGMSYGGPIVNGRMSVYLHQPTKIARFEAYLREYVDASDIVIKYVSPDDPNWRVEPT